MRNSNAWAAWLAPCLLAVAACEGDGTPPSKVGPGDVIPGDQAEDFVSEVYGQSNGRGDEDDAADGGEEPSAGDDGGGAERAISEADILKVEGDTLYALSRYAGLSIIDISNPQALKLVGRYRTNAMPFEMYLENQVAYIMYNEWGSYEYDEESGGFSWQSASHMLALDVKDPAHVTRIAEQLVPGSIADSRKVGDVIYLVTYENGYCWECDQKPATRVVSFDVKNRARFTRVDELRFDGDESSWQRSISVNPSRIYVAGPTWEDRDSSIQVVDISDPAGDLKLGAEVPIHGSVESRWQMDEYEGVLRVISQPTPWRSNDAPEVQTFRVTDANHIAPLATLPVSLPRPEDLQSVRFDGTRAYAVTFEQTDPLFTFDLTDPAAPKQMGALEIPGFVVHMEPRGDRIYALGNDWNNPSGALHVSIFDVSDLAHPTMLSRVNFGGDWAYVAEDQDRIHKAFNLQLDAGMIFVPFGGGNWDESYCSYSYQSGIQIIDVDVAAGALALRGVAPQLGEARRSFLHDGRLFGVTDNAVQVFDIADRDAPVAMAKLEVARNVGQVRVVGDKVLRFGADWWTDRAVLDVADKEHADTAAPRAELVLSEATEEGDCQRNAYWPGSAYVHGQTAYVPRSIYNYGDQGYRQEMEFFVIDLSASPAPRLAGSFRVTATEGESLGGVVMTDGALLVGRSTGYYDYDPETGTRSTPTYSYDIYDLTNPLAPTFATRFDVPSDLSFGGWGYGFYGCDMDMAWGWWRPDYGQSALVSGDLVVSQHEEALDDGTGRVRYYLDRLDVSNPRAPRLLAPINIPGQVVQFDADAGRAVTIDYVYSEQSADSWDDCYAFANAWYDDSAHACRIYERRLNSLRVEDDVARRASMLMLDATRVSSEIAVSNERVFFTTHEPHAYDDPRPPALRLESLAFSDEAELVRLPDVSLGNKVWWWSNLSARGTHAFISLDSGLAVVDTSNASAPRYVEHDLQGWGCSSLDVDGERAYCALGMFGVATIDL